MPTQDGSPRTLWPWWFPGALLRAYGLVVLGLGAHVARLSRDPWSQVWHIPGRSLALVLVQPLPLAFGLLLFWCLAGWWITNPQVRAGVRLSAACAMTLFCTLDGAYSAIAERHLLEPGQLSFLFRDRAFLAASVLSPRLIVVVGAVLVAYTWFLVRGIADVRRPAPIIPALASLALVVVIDVGVLLRATPGQRDLYGFAINSNPIYGIQTISRLIALGAQPGLKTTVPGLQPQGILPPPQAGVPGRALIEPKLFLIILLDGFRADFLTPELAPRIHAIAEKEGLIVDNYYASYPGTDRSVYSLFYGRHPVFADQDFLFGRQPASPWLTLLRKRGYAVEAFQSNPVIYRFLPRLYKEFDQVHFGTADVDAPASDAATLKALETRIAALTPGGRLFAFVLLHSTHFPYNGRRLGSPTENYTDAVRYLDGRVGEFVRGLVDGGASFLALVGGDHGTQLGECGSYRSVHPETLHTAMAAMGSKDVSPAIERLRAMQGSMLRVESLMQLVLGPGMKPAVLRQPAAQWNVAISGGAFGTTAPITIHNLAGDAMHVELGRDSATWQCGRLEDCGEYSGAACRPELLAQAGAALLRFQRGPSTPRRK